MKKTLLKLSLALLVVATSFTACKKDKDVAYTKENLAGTYKLASVSINGQNIPLNQVPELDECEIDDLYQLNVDFSAKYIDAGVKCVPPGDDDNTSWELLPNNRIIVVDLEGEIKSFDGKSLVVGETITEQGITMTYRITLVKQ